ncbi:restriction endonuclease subunit S [Leuconostoc mesenteroides]|uniref:restriction endonuclease subunit S n=1 Tax=Leuconostoc mesenteroides TaxID=1245 RepID=UPI0023619732|nr:restriction endonuclease subunit S [Leuconostoc mesenteroides]
MQTKKRKSPSLRFRGYTDDWEERKLKDVTERVRSNDGRMDLPTLTMSASSGWLDQKDRFSGDISGKEKKNYTLLKKGELSYNHGNSKLAKYGVVFSLTNYEEALVPRVYHSFKALENTSADFIEYMFSTKLPDRELGKLISSGARMDGLLNINYDDFMNIHISIPNYEEQILMSAFFRKLDENIALHQRKLDLLKEQKKGFLQKMFPKNGSRVPELRFSGFADDWEELKLGEFSDVRDGTHASPKYVSQGHPMVTSKNLTHSGLDMTDVSFLTDEDFNEINKRSKVSIGDILFGMIGTIGNPVIVDRDDFAIKNVALIKEKTSNPITNKWLLQYLKSPSFNRFIQKENAGGTQKFIALGLIRDMKLRVPEFDEQQKIGAFFKKIDETIALHQRKLDLLKEQKKGFLQKMFV